MDFGQIGVDVSSCRKHLFERKFASLGPAPNNDMLEIGKARPQGPDHLEIMVRAKAFRGKQRANAGLSERVSQVFFAKMGVERNEHAADQGHSELDDGPLDPVLGDQSDMGAIAEPEPQESTGNRCRALMQFEIAEALSGFGENERVAAAPFSGVASDCGTGSR